MATMTPAVEQAQAAAEGNDLQAKTVILQFALGTLGTRRKMSKGQVDDKVTVDADKDYLHVSKEILRSARLTALRAHDRMIRNYIRSKSVPSFYRGGFYLVAVGAVPEIDAGIQAMLSTRRGLVQSFLEEYPSLVEKAQDSLKGVYDLRDYPSVGQVEAAFTVDTRYLSFSTPSTLKGISADIFKRESENMRQSIQSATEEITQLLRTQAHELLAHMVERLEPDADGKPKVFKASMVTNITDFLDNFDIRNVADDAELAQIMGNVRSLLSGVDAKQLRTQEGAREAIRAQVGQIAMKLDGMVVKKPKRAVTFGDAEVVE
jgi:hypothetical protein